MRFNSCSQFCRKANLNFLIPACFLILVFASFDQLAAQTQEGTFDIPDPRVLSGGKLTGRFKPGSLPGGIVVKLRSSDPAIATVKPDQFTVKPGEDTTIEIEAQNLRIQGENSTGAPVDIEAYKEGEVLINKISVTVYPLLIAPDSITAGDNITATIKLLAPAPANGARVNLSSSSSELTVPDSVTVPTGLSETEFKIPSNTIGNNSQIKVSAVYLDGSQVKGAQTVAVNTRRNDGLLWISILVGIFTNILAFALVPMFFGARKVIKHLIMGKDDLPSTSKAQNLLWTFFVLLAYSSIATAKLFTGHDVNISITRNVVIVMGISFATRILAGMITANQVQEGKTYKRSPMQTEQYLEKEGGGNWKILSHLFTDDNGRVDLNKIQIMAWTFIAIFIFATQWGRNLFHANIVSMGLPIIDDALVVLMGLASGVFVGGKLVIAPPTISQVEPDHGKPGDAFTIHGSSFGEADPTNRVLFRNDKNEVVASLESPEWTNTSVKAVVPQLDKKAHKIQLLAKGIPSENTKDFKVE